MTRARRHCLLLALASACLLAAAGIVTAPALAVYGGIGPVDQAAITSGKEGGKGQVNPTPGGHWHEFAVDPQNGDLLIADEYTQTLEKGKLQGWAHIQEFGPAPGGKFIAQATFKLKTRSNFVLQRVAGLAIDAEKNRAYVLVDEERPAESEKIEEKIEKLEEKLTELEAKLAEAKAKKETAKEAQLEKEIGERRTELAKLESELPVFDPEVEAAAEVLAFSTSPEGESLKQEKLAEKPGEVLQPGSEEEKVPLLDPTGIAVDPVSHDLLISGQQDESSKKGSEFVEEDWRAAVQVVHDNGSLGPRYVDTENCLDEGSGGEAACRQDVSALGSNEYPSSPIVSTGGRLFLDLGGEEIWQVPDSEGVTEEFKSGEKVADHTTKPTHLYTLEGEHVFAGVSHEEEGGEMAFAPVEPAKKHGFREGRIYLDANIAKELERNAGVLVLDYVEPETAGQAEVSEEVGWTGGQPPASEQPGCVLRSGSSTPVLLAGGKGEEVFAFDTATPTVFEFGSGGEACGHSEPVLSGLAANTDKTKEATEVGVGEPVTFTSQLTVAQAKEVSWTITPIGEGESFSETSRRLEEAPKLAHEFKESGEYEITEKVTTDDLGYPSSKTATIKLKVRQFKLSLAQPHNAKVGEAVSLAAQVTDNSETPPHIKYKWTFGDGTFKEGTETGSGNKVVIDASHPYASAGRYEVTLRVEDGHGLVASEATHVEISEEKHEPPPTNTGSSTPPSSSPPASGPPVEEHKEVLGVTTVHNPEAKLAGNSISVSAKGALTLKVTCPTGETACTGSVTLRTLTAVSAGARKKKAILTLASASFDVAGGQLQAVVLHLSGAARGLLAHSHVLHVSATLVAHDSYGTTRTVKTTVTLRLAASHKK